MIRNDLAFAGSNAKLDLQDYRKTVESMKRSLFDRDTPRGAEPEDPLRCDIPVLIVPGRDASQTSAARYLDECLPKAEYWDVRPDEQTEQTAAARLLGFLDGVRGA